SGSCDVLFDEQLAWSFTAKGRRRRDRDGEVLVVWPPRMQRWLNGASYVRVVEKDTEYFAGEVVFGDGEGRVEFVDRDGIPVMIDKWGLLQRPFSGRDSRVIVQMVDMTEEILEVMRRECGVHGWIAFGTLLGALREGRVIGHDSDIDLAYVSAKATPAEMTLELYGIGRALRSHGMTVLDKSGSFITVVFPVPDNSLASIDVYTCFYLGERLYETATVREVVPRSAIEPLTEVTFEGRLLPAPAEPERMLAVSYGDGWRVPDPSFQHEPGPEITSRFDGWFGSLMRNRRDWERYLADLGKDPDHGPSDFAGWVADRLEPGTTVIEMGSGTGQDAVFLGSRGFPVRGFDYARTSLRPARREARRRDVPVKFQPLNLYDLRDVLTRGVLVCRKVPQRSLYARRLLESLDPDGQDNFWRLAGMLLRGGGRAYLEGQAAAPRDRAEWRSEHGGGKQQPVDPRVVEGVATRAGGRVVHRDGFLAAGAALAGGPPAQWRMIVEWPEETQGVGGA
ncbi:MAG: hypothetical protein ACR2JD_04075, partial [Nocardioides sp.]